MRRDDLYLNDIVEAADHIATFLGQTDLEGFRQSELVRSAVVQKLAVIGEAAARISDAVKGRYPQIPRPPVTFLSCGGRFSTFSQRSSRSRNWIEELLAQQPAPLPKPEPVTA